MTASVSESSASEVSGYDGQLGYSDYNPSGGRMREKKKSRRRRSRKMYGGNNEENGPTGGEGSVVSQNDVSTQGPGSEQDGGRRRRGKTHKGKMYKGKMYKGKIRKGKTRKGKVSKWIIHVKNYSRTNNMDFRDALKDRNCKASYHKMK